MKRLLRSLVQEYPKAWILGAWYPNAKECVVYHEGQGRGIETVPLVNLLLKAVHANFDSSEASQTRNVVMAGAKGYYVLEQLPGGAVLIFGHDAAIPAQRFLSSVSDLVLTAGVDRNAGVVSMTDFKAASVEEGQVLEQTILQASPGHARLHESLLAAQRSQTQLLSDTTPIRPFVQDLAVLYQPKELIGGDFYYFQPHDDGFWFALGDYTGHGVEGAMGAMMCSSLLTNLMASRAVLTPTQVMLRLHQSLLRLVGNSNNKSNRQPGLELLFGQYVASTRRIQLVTAGIETLFMQRGHAIEVPRLRFALGSTTFDDTSLTPFEAEVSPSDVLAFFTDGLKDQLDAAGRRRIGRKKIHEVVQANLNGSFRQLPEAISTTVADWRGPVEQTDDISLIGLKF